MEKGETMTKKKVMVERVTFVSNRSFEDVLRSLDKCIGRPNLAELGRQMNEAPTFEEYASIIHGAVGSADLMEFLRLDLGSVLRKDPAAKAYKIVRIMAGNPLIMKQMTEHVPDAGSYAPITILVYEREDGVHVSYDTMASYLAASENEKALQVAKDLDAKVLHLLTEATAPA
jgi:uncharacterized protein (DUF302 family)